MSEELFQEIFDKLQDALPDEWKKVIFYAAYYEDSYSMKYYVDNGSGKYVDCFSLGVVPKGKLIKLFMGIDKIITPIRKKLTDKEKWTCLTMTVGANGSFRTKFDYKKIDDPIEYEQKWKKKNGIELSVLNG